MGSNAGPKIILSNLNTYYDPANIVSYSGAGLTINNLLGGTGATLVNGPVFSSGNLGIFTLDGTNDYINLTLSSLTAYTVQFFINIVSYDNTERQILGTTSDVVGLSLLRSSNLNKFNIWNGASNVSNTQFSTGVWYNVAYTRSGSSTLIYLNGAVDGTFANGAAISAGTATIGWLSGTSRYLNAILSDFKIYDRALTAIEIVQNYNATRSRYGI